MRKEPRLEQFEFNGQQVDVYFHQLKPSESLVFLLYLGKIVGGSAGKFIGAMDGASLAELANKTEFNMDKIGDAIATLFDRFDEKETIAKLNLLLSSAKMNGVSIHIDGPLFDGNLKPLFRAVKIALEVNYSDFLDVISGLLKKVADRMPSSKNTLKVQP